MRTFKVAVLIIIITGLWSCRRKPEAYFTTDKAEYLPRETVHLTNKSDKAFSYKWTMPDGRVLIDKDVDYVIPESTPAGKLVFKLESFAKRGIIHKRKAEFTQPVNIYIQRGNAIFWHKQGTPYGNTTVELNNIERDIQSQYPSAPACYSGGCANFTDLIAGTYEYTATSINGVTKTWTGTLKVLNNSCTEILLE